MKGIWGGRTLEQALSRRPLWHQLALLAIVTALPLVIASLLMFSRLAANERAGIEQGLLVSARTLAALADNEIDTHMAIATTLARSPALKSDDLRAFRQEAVEALGFVPGSWLNVIAPDGRIIMSTLRPLGQPLPKAAEQAMLVKAFAENKPQVGGVVLGPISGTLRAFLHVPVFREGSPHSIIAISLAPKRFLNLMQGKFTQGEVVAIVDGSKKFVARIPDHDARVGTLSAEGWRQAMAEAPEGIVENLSVEGNWILTGYAPTKYGWTVGVAQLKSAIQGPLRRILWSSLAIFGVLALLSAGLAVAIARHSSRGMIAIAAAARDLGEGKPVGEVQAPFAEAKTVATALAGASAELDSRGKALALANSELEHKVEQRTAELTEEMHRRESAEATLRQSQKMESLGQLTGGIAHDFNNMLTIIIGNLDMLKRRMAKIDEAATLAKPVESALHGARSAAKLTHRLLAFSRQQPLEPTALELNGLIAGISDMLVRTVGEQVRIETVLGAGLWPAFADASQLESALVNLAINARDAMPTGGKLTIETANAYLDDDYAQRFFDLAPGQYAMLSVSDTGTGIHPERMERIFEPFFTTKGMGKGTGLGLAMVHGFVKQSGGHIRVYSEVGHGTTVKIYLPRSDAEAAGAATPERRNRIEAAAPPQARRGETLLLVEDDPGVREYSVGVLSDLGYKVLAAESGERALDLLKNAKRIDLLFTDVVLGDGLNGRELADKVLAARPGLPVLFTTGYTRNAIVHHGRLDAHVHLLGKPYSQRDLAEKIRSLLDKRCKG